MREKKIELVDANITELDVDAIVNAANNTLLGGGGVDGAIHRAAGPQLLVECRQLNGCASGQAKITGGHRLLAAYVIHTVGPVWRGGEQDEAELLASCYQQCFQLAAENKIKSIALPAISTGVYGFPKDKAAEIAIHETLAALAVYPGIRRVIMVCFGQETRAAYENALQAER